MITFEGMQASCKSQVWKWAINAIVVEREPSEDASVKERLKSRWIDPVNRLKETSNVPTELRPSEGGMVPVIRFRSTPKYYSETGFSLGMMIPSKALL